MTITHIHTTKTIPTNFETASKNSDIVYGQVYIGNNTKYTGWNKNFLEWKKDNGHGIFIKYVQDERTTPVGYLLYTHKMSNSTWYQTALSKKCGVPITSRLHKISGQKSTDRSAVYLE